jgi:hypothetical protein
MIEQLTPEQIARFPEFVEKWTKIGFSTEPVDRSYAGECVSRLYRDSGLHHPSHIVWFDNPVQMLNEHTKIKGNAIARIIRELIGDKIFKNVWPTVEGDICDSINIIVRHNVKDKVWNKVWRYIMYLVKGSASGHVGDVVYGVNDIHWMAEYDFYREVLGLVGETNHVVGSLDLVKSCNLVIPCSGVCFACERPSVLKLDNKGKLHCEDGPAMVYPDGWSVYIDHGVRVSKKMVVDPSGFTLSDLQQMDLDRVKIILRKIGMGKFMAIKGTTSDTWTNLFNQIAKETIND